MNDLPSWWPWLAVSTLVAVALFCAWQARLIAKMERALKASEFVGKVSTMQANEAYRRLNEEIVKWEWPDAPGPIYLEHLLKGGGRF